MKKLELENFGFVEMSSEEMMHVEGGFLGIVLWAIAGFLIGMAMYVSEQLN